MFLEYAAGGTAYVQEHGGAFPKGVRETVETIARAGGTPLVVAEGNRVLGVVQLKDIVKGDEQRHPGRQRSWQL